MAICGATTPQPAAILQSTDRVDPRDSEDTYPQHRDPANAQRCIVHSMGRVSLNSQESFPEISDANPRALVCIPLLMVDPYGII